MLSFSGGKARGLGEGERISMIIAVSSLTGKRRWARRGPESLVATALCVFLVEAFSWNYVADAPSRFINVPLPSGNQVDVTVRNRLAGDPTLIDTYVETLDVTV